METINRFCLPHCGVQPLEDVRHPFMLLESNNQRTLRTGVMGLLCMENVSLIVRHITSNNLLVVVN